MLSCCPNLLFHFDSAVFIFYSFHGLVMWGWDLRTERVSSFSPSLAVLTFFFIIILLFVVSMLPLAVNVGHGALGAPPAHHGAAPGAA